MKFWRRFGCEVLDHSRDMVGTWEGNFQHPTGNDARWWADFLFFTVVKCCLLVVAAALAVLVTIGQGILNGLFYGLTWMWYKRWGLVLAGGAVAILFLVWSLPGWWKLVPVCPMVGVPWYAMQMFGILGTNLSDH